MVTQYKDNPLEKKFYALDQKWKMAEYKRGYYLPEIESRLSYVINHRAGWNYDSEENKVKRDLDLLRNELTHEANLVNKDIPELNQLAIGKFDSSVYKKTNQFIKNLKEYYAIRSRNAQDEREKMMVQLTDDEQEKVAFDNLKNKYQNEAVTNMVENIQSPKRIVEWKGELIQKLYPIYFNEHKPENRFDFRDNFFIPAKYFMGQKIDTLYFNLCMIWLMTIILYITLYYELLQKAVHGALVWKRYGRKLKAG
jgi:hypothetical protein